MGGTAFKLEEEEVTKPIGKSFKLNEEAIVTPDQPAVTVKAPPIKEVEVEKEEVKTPQATEEKTLRQRPEDLSLFEQRKRAGEAKRKDKRAEFGIDKNYVPILSELGIVDSGKEEEVEVEEFAQPERLATGDKPFGQNLLDYVDTTPDEKITDADLVKDSKFIEASAIIFRINHGRDFDVNKDSGTLGEYGIRFMGYFNYNLTKMTFDTARIAHRDGVAPSALLYLMESYDDLGLSMAGTGRFFKGVGSDPLTLAGLSTLGLGFIATGTARIAGKITTKEFIKAGLKAGVVSGIEGGTYMAVDSINRQVVEGDGVTLSRTAKDTAIGVGVGFGLGGTIGGSISVIKTLIGRNSKKIANDVPVDPLKGADDPAVKVGDDANVKEPKVENIKDLPKEGKAKEIGTTLQKVIQAIRKSTPDKPIAIDASGARNVSKLKAIIKPISDLLQTVKTKKVKEIETFLLNQSITPNQMRTLKSVAAKAASDIKITHKDIIKASNKETDPVKVKALRKQADDLEGVVNDIDLLDQALGTSTGRELESRKWLGINKNDVVGTNVKALMDNQGLSRADAEEEFVRMVERAELKIEKDIIIKEANEKIQKISAKGIPEGASEIQIQKQLIKDTKEEIYQAGLGKTSWLKRTINNKILKPVAEFMIGAVFSPPTVMINMVPSILKTIYKPFVNAIAFGGPRSTRIALRKMMAEYSAMASFTPVAWRSAKFAFLNEQAILTGNYNRLLEGQTQSLPGFFGRMWRIFPRVLLATDAFFEQIHYRAYMSGTTTSSALEAGIAKGLKGKKLEKHVKAAMKDAMDKAYDQSEDVLERLTTMGTAKGLKGEKLNIWVRKQMDKNPQILKEATNENGKSYVRDLLFKRAFGQGMDTKSTAGIGADAYESFVSKNPIMRIMGQLFFRTPVRVFEEGVRMTPGLQFFAPRFLDDLKGKNGNARQIRANGEAMVGLAIVGYVYTQWAQNKATGAGPEDYKQRRGIDASGQREPYTFTNSDGSTWSYRYMDPFATPIKIIINMFERSEHLMYRVEQGERLDMAENDKISGWVGAMAGSIAQSFRDASLLSGAVETLKLFETVFTEKSTTVLRKFAGKKIGTLVPNTYYKIMLQTNPEIADPLTLEQYIINKADPGNKKIPLRYSPLGKIQTLASARNKLWMFDTTTVSERERGMTKDELMAEQYLYLLSEATDSSFIAPYKHDLFRGDLRVTMMPDGSKTMYDRWMELVNTRTGIVKTIAGYARAKVPYGNPTGSKGKEKVREALTKARNIAAQLLLLEVMKSDERFIGDIIKKKVRLEYSKGGLLDVAPPKSTKNKSLLETLTTNK